MRTRSSVANLCALAGASLLSIVSSRAHAAPASLQSPYSQTFDTLANAGSNVAWSDDLTLPAWYASRVSYSAGAGSSNTGSLYSFGSAAASDRALGSVASGGTGAISYGVRLVNDTNQTITSLAVQYSGEQWRDGGSSTTTPSAAQRIDFSYRVSAGDLTGGTFADFDALDFVSPLFNTLTPAPLDGNLTVNRSTVSATISRLSIAPGQIVWLQWSDANDVNNDHGLAIDDLTVTIAGTSGGGGGDSCTESDLPIGSVQGSGDSAAITGTVTVQGVVVGDYEGPQPALRGFYLQDERDADPATSNAIFVFNGDGNSVSLGDEVQVTGLAGEFQGQTQISGVSSIEVCGSGRTIEPSPIQLPVASGDFLERYEGMLVRFNQPLVVTELFQLGRFGQVTLTSGERLYQPTNVAEPGSAAAAVQAANNLDRIIVDDALQSQNPDPIVFGRGGLPLSASNTLRGGDTVSGLQGVLTYTWAGNAASGNAFRVRPVNALGSTLPNFQPTNARPAAAASVGGSLRVASFNLLNFFNTFGSTACSFGVGGPPAECRGANNASEFARQAQKTVAAIAALDADVLGVIEIENDGYGPSSAIAELVQRVNAAVGAGTYAFIDIDAASGRVNAAGTDAIKVAILYKPGALTAVAGKSYADDAPVHNRAPVAQLFALPTGQRFSFVVNHFKSKGCDGATGADADLGDGQGCFNARRVAQAEALLSFIDELRADTGDADVLVMGDLNAYAKEDPIRVIEAAGFVNAIAQFGGPQAYSYVFDGQWGYLDHALASASLAPQLAGAADFHINADEPSVLDYNTDFKSAGQIASLYAPDMFRTSDHDPVVVGLSLSGAPAVPAAGCGYLLSLGVLLGGALLAVRVRDDRKL